MKKLRTNNLTDNQVCVDKSTATQKKRLSKITCAAVVLIAICLVFIAAFGNLTKNKLLPFGLEMGDSYETCQIKLSKYNVEYEAYGGPLEAFSICGSMASDYLCDYFGINDFNVKNLQIKSFDLDFDRNNNLNGFEISIVGIYDEDTEALENLRCPIREKYNKLWGKPSESRHNTEQKQSEIWIGDDYSVRLFFYPFYNDTRYTQQNYNITIDIS